MLVGGLPTKTRPSGGCENEPFVVPPAVRTLIGDYPLDPASPDLFRKASLENKSGFLEIEVHYSKVKPLGSGDD